MTRFPARFTHGDNILREDSQFDAWKIQHAIEAQNCSAVFRPPDYRPVDDDEEIFSHSAQQQMKSAVLGYLKSNVQPDVYSEYIDNLMEPAAIMEILQSLVLRTTATTFEETLTTFNNLQYDPASQDIVEFNARFNKLMILP